MKRTFPADHFPQIADGPEIVTLETGDRITFCAPTTSGAPRITRTINGFSAHGEPTVRAHGWSHFVVRRHEVSAILPGRQEGRS